MCLNDFFSDLTNLKVFLQLWLANHLLETYNDIQYIVWTDVAEKPEFSGHTANSLKNITFHGLKVNARSKFGLSKSEITLVKVQEYSLAVYGEGRKTREHVIKHQRLVIEYFEERVSQLGLKNLF